MSSLPGRPVVAVDIDGTIGIYHNHFIRFAEQYVGRTLEPEWRPEFRGEFNRALHMSKRVYRDIKLAYRQGGLKRSMPVFEGARELTVSLRKAGAEVWICTTRPYLRLDNIDPDTRHMLKRQGIQYDGVLFGERKYHDLVKIVGKDRIVAVLDDLPSQVESAGRLGLTPILRRDDHNAWYDNPKEFTDVHTLEAAQLWILWLLELWRDPAYRDQ